MKRIPYRPVPATRKCVAVAAIGLCVAVLMCAGCTNAPGAAKMTITPEKQTFYSDEPICLNATIRAEGGSICLVRGFHVAVELRPPSPLPPMEACDGGITKCATGLMLMLPVLPVYFSAAYLDVGNLGGRFIVVPKGLEKPFHLSLEHGQYHLNVHSSERERNFLMGRSERPLSPGPYVIQVSLWNETDDPFPPPLFWKPYDKRVVGETEVVIVNRPTTTRSTTRPN